MASNRSPRLPDFIGIGPGRTGTTWLHQVLESRCDLPRGVKETQFFTTYYAKGIGWYAWHFRHATGARKVAEVCPYFSRPLAAERIKHHLPDCKFIVTLRNPAEHAYSQYKLMIHYVWARGSFEQVLNTRPQLDRSRRYADHFKGWFAHFPRERFLITRYEELRGDPQSYIDRICDFVEVERIRLSELGSIRDDVNNFARAPKNRHLAQNARHVQFWLLEHRAYAVVNALKRAGVWQFCYGRGEKFPPLTPEQDAMLIERFRPNVEALEDLLRIDLSEWKRPRAERPAKPGLPRDDVPRPGIAAAISQR
ncbi:MAG: sulfotransferase family protein [Candidatus Binataceae bacterium]